MYYFNSVLHPLTVLMKTTEDFLKMKILIHL